MTTTSPQHNKALVLKAFDMLFNKRDYVAAERFWSDTYAQHSAHIPPGRDGLFNLVGGLPDTLRYDNQVILAERDYVIGHGRFSGNGRPRSWIAADVVRIENGKLAEHWDVLQDEATKEESQSGLPMFGDRFPAELGGIQMRNIRTLTRRGLLDVGAAVPFLAGLPQILASAATNADNAPGYQPHGASIRTTTRSTTCA